jgi:hypothetical protein
MLPKVRELPPHVRVIMISAYGDPETKRKPIDLTLLREEIDTRLQQVN